MVLPGPASRPPATGGRVATVAVLEPADPAAILLPSPLNPLRPPLSPPPRMRSSNEGRALSAGLIPRYMHSTRNEEKKQGNGSANSSYLIVRPYLGFRDARGDVDVRRGWRREKSVPSMKSTCCQFMHGCHSTKAVM